MSNEVANYISFQKLYIQKAQQNSLLHSLGMVQNTKTTFDCGSYSHPYSKSKKDCLL
jgi:hypothetical protein